jgi:hypothetical protein
MKDMKLQLHRVASVSSSDRHYGSEDCPPFSTRTFTYTFESGETFVVECFLSKEGFSDDNQEN